MTQPLVHIGEVIVLGILFDPKNAEAWRNMDVVQNIYRSVPKLFELLDERQIDYVLVGGIAMLVCPPIGAVSRRTAVAAVFVGLSLISGNG